jgi:hypothetical protein
VRPVTNAQVRKLMEQMQKHGEIGRAAMVAGMDRKTARKYVSTGKLPAELAPPRDWRTREDPFADDWPRVVELLEGEPELEAKTIFEQLLAEHPGRYEAGQLRTLQRHVRQWRAEHGPDRDVVLAQAHRPGEAAQTDFTWATELGVRIAGVLFEHMLCVFVLPFSNWAWATICTSESLAALRRGVQAALFQLGRVPEFHQTDNSTAATHRIPDGKGVVVDSIGRRPFNAEYLALVRHFGMTPRTTAIGAKEQNGDVEAGNGAVKRRLGQALLLRGSTDFESVKEWERFLHDVMRRANSGRGKRLIEELAAMRPLVVARLPEFVEEDVTVSEWSTVRVKHCAYSVPSRLIGRSVRVRLFEDRVEVWFGRKLQLDCERLVGRHRKRIDYRHVIWSLVRKPGGFARYVYREEMFPSATFRRAYDAIQTPHRGTRGDVEYLRILHLAASTMEADVEVALDLLLATGADISSDAVKALTAASSRPEVPVLAREDVDLSGYDELLTDGAIQAVGT